MPNFLISLTEDQHRALRDVSAATGMSVREHLRRTIAERQPVWDSALSGAMVEAVYARTTSGDVVIGRGF